MWWPTNFPAPLTVSLPGFALAYSTSSEALAKGEAEGMNPLTVVVLDAGGHIVAMKRADGSGILRTEVAFGKAYAALGMGASTRGLNLGLADRPAFQGQLAAASGGRFIAVPGGVLVREKDGAVAIGSVGVSGDTSDRDEECAVAGIQAAGLEPMLPGR